MRSLGAMDNGVIVGKRYSDDARVHDLWGHLVVNIKNF